jgi:hypothetical protein
MGSLYIIEEEYEWSINLRRMVCCLKAKITQSAIFFNYLLIKSDGILTPVYQKHPFCQAVARVVDAGVDRVFFCLVSIERFFFGVEDVFGMTTTFSRTRA